MADNTTRQLARWKQGEAITAYKLNQIVEAVNFLLNTTGYIFNRVALANYVPTDASSFNYPGILEAVETRAGLTAPRIEAGTLVLPEQAGGGLNAVTYDSTALTPSVSGGTLTLNLANYEASGGSAFPGSLVGVTYDTTAQTPSITNGTLNLNLANYEPNSGSAFPGAMAGVKLYDPSDPSSPTVPGITAGVLQLPAGLNSVQNASGSITPQPEPGRDGWVETLYFQYYATYAVRQLMRVHGSTLQVVPQGSTDNGVTWVDI